MKTYQFVTILVLLVLANCMLFLQADPTCKEAKRLKETPTTHERWMAWEEKYHCQY